MRNLIREAAAGDRNIDLWFGRHVTALPEGTEPAPLRRPPSERAFANRLRGSRRVKLATASRAAFTRMGRNIALFVNGRAHEIPATCTAFVQALADHGEAAVPGRVPPALLRALHAEYGLGTLVFRPRLPT
jgi:hypothetical protein